MNDQNNNPPETSPGNPEPGNVPLIDVLGIIKKSWGLYKEHITSFLIFSIAAVLPFTILQNPYISSKLGVFNLIAVIISIYIAMWGTVGLIMAINAKLDNQDVHAKQVFQDAREKIGKYFWTQAFITLMATVGFYLFILPGFYLGVILSLSCIVVVFQRCHFFDSFKISFNLIKGNFWKVFLLIYIPYAVFALITIVVRSVCSMLRMSGAEEYITSILTIFWTPFNLSILVIAYKWLKRAKPLEEYTLTPSTVPKGMGFVGLLMLIGLLVVVLSLGSFWYKTLEPLSRTKNGQMISKLLFGERVCGYVPKSKSKTILEDIELIEPELYH